MEQIKKKEQPKHFEGITIQATFALLSIVIGGLLTFVEEVNIRTLCTAFCIILLIAGVLSSVYFFASGGYKRLRDYSLSFGILLLILGCCGLIKSESLEASFVAYIGFAMLILGVLTLQNTIQLTVMKCRLNILAFTFALLILAASIISITGFEPVINAIENFPQMALLISGVFNLIGFLVTAVVLHQYHRLKERQRKEEDDGNVVGEGQGAEESEVHEEV